MKEQSTSISTSTRKRDDGHARRSSQWRLAPALVCLLLLALALVIVPSQAQGEAARTRASTVPQTQVGTAFTYQGRLLNPGGNPANGEHDFQLTLYDELTSTTPIGTVIIEDHPVDNGLFTVEVDFGPDLFKGDARYLEIATRPGNDTGAYLVAGRGPLTPTPYALALPGLWTQQNPTSPNVIGGHPDNYVAPGVYGATIGGGSTGGWYHQVVEHYGTIGGGSGNIVAGWSGTIGGGINNIVTNAGATVGGGSANSAGGYLSTIGGGEAINVTGQAATVAGGSRITVTNDYAAVGGGQYNTASGLAATVGGGAQNTASQNLATVSGGWLNSAGGEQATISGGYFNTASGFGATVGGGWLNSAGHAAATVSGGEDNTASGEHAAVGGGYLNDATSDNATVGGGLGNDAIGEAATVGGGQDNMASGGSATVGGGSSNNASGDLATIGGGHQNVVTATSATIGGGWGNNATRHDATVGGGYSNNASGAVSTVGGGHSNTAGNSYATVGGGHNNIASGEGATIPGGEGNAASGSYSFAAGRLAKAEHQGAFVWADHRYFDFSSISDNTFRAQATGGVEFVLGIDEVGGTTWSCQASDSASWACSSDRDLKENLVVADGALVLQQLEGMPIYTWNGKGQDPGVRHMGPMAQDFYAAYGLGESDTHIATIDLDGVALAAVQELHARNQALQEEVSSYKEENAAQQKQIDDLEARLAVLEQGSASPAPAAGASPWLLGGLVAVVVAAAAVVVARYQDRLLPRKGGRR